MSSAYLAVSDRTRDGRPRADRDRDDLNNPSIRIVGVSRPSALRALLARSITMTALEIERRRRIRLRKPNTRGLLRPSPVSGGREPGSAQQQLQLMEAQTFRWAPTFR